MEPLGQEAQLTDEHGDDHEDGIEGLRCADGQHGVEEDGLGPAPVVDLKQVVQGGHCLHPQDGVHDSMISAVDDGGASAVVVARSRRLLSPVLLAGMQAMERLPAAGC